MDDDGREPIIDLSSRMAKAEELFALAFEQAPIGIALVGPDGRWLRVNAALCRLTGYRAAELLAPTFQQITYPDNVATDLALRDELLAGRMSQYELEKHYIRKDGSVVW